MDKNQMLRQRIQAASGTKKAELVLKNASIVNVFTCELETADIAIEGGPGCGPANPKDIDSFSTQFERPVRGDELVE